MPKQAAGTSKVEAVIKTSLKNAFVRKLKGRSQKGAITDMIKKFVKG